MIPTTSSPVDVSVIIPAFNVAEYIGEALASASRQNPPFRQIIVIDDGSTDATRSIVKGLSNPRIVYHYQDNRGLGAARNAGIALAKSKFLYFMDGDDTLANGMTQFIQEELTDASPAPDAVLFAAVVVNETDDRRLPNGYYRRLGPGEYNSGRDALVSSLKRDNFLASACLYVFWKPILDEQPKLRFLDILHEDEVFTPALLLRCKQTVISNKVLYKRRVQPDSITTSKSSERNVRGLLQASQYWLEYASTAKGIEKRLFVTQAHHCYCAALRHASRARLGRVKTIDIVTEFAPVFRKYVIFDYTLASLSRRAAFDLGHVRGKLLGMLNR